MDEYIDELVAGWAEAQGGPPEGPPAPPEEARGAWRVVLDDGERGGVRACDGYLSGAEQAALFAHCAALPQWEYDKPLGSLRGARQRRGVCMQAAPGTPAMGGYRYSGQTVAAVPLDDRLGPLLARVNAEHGTDFNSWFLNLYRPRGTGGSAGDYIGKHADNERELGVAADGRSVVFGLTLTDRPDCRRPLRFERKDGSRALDLETAGGQAYVMEGALQKHWVHSLPRRLGVPGTRISLTARKFV